jgi:hypothetical protein
MCMFVTMACAVLDGETGSFFASAGTSARCSGGRQR